MAVTRTIAKPVVKEEERLESAILTVRQDGSYALSVRRQVLGRAQNNELLSVRRAERPVERASGEVANETVTLASGTVIRLVDVVEALDLLADRWAGEDVARAEEARNRPEPVVGRRAEAGRPE
jgi:hypothetical protein